MRPIVIIAAFFSLFFLISPRAYAIEDPLSIPNNKIGVHILFDSELPAAAQLVNANGGDWGYVTIPIQAGDKDLTKWQNFMDNAKTLHVIPIIRLATEGDYFNTSVWRKPTDEDILDFANFLDSLDWPVKNRYIVVFNETNRGDEWGGSANPEEYANILYLAISTFKAKNPDYFIISAGLDNGAPNDGDSYINEYNYIRQMNDAVSGIFGQVDGIASHSYPNPGFSQPPNLYSSRGTNSFHFEQQLADYLGKKTLPAFITETGWSGDALSDDIRAAYLQEALSSVWDDNSVVAVTPFVLQADGGPFQQFAFIANGQQTKSFQFLKSLQKSQGKPTINISNIAGNTNFANSQRLAVVKNFSQEPANPPHERFTTSFVAEDMFKWLMGI